MENASKALIIAGAILIPILIISFGVIILGQGSDVINNADMSEAEVTTYNGKFEAYEGTAVRGSNVKQMCKIVKQHNLKNQDDSSKQVMVVMVSKPASGTTLAKSSATDGDIVKKDGKDGTNAANVKSGNAYIVKCFYGQGGLVEQIAIAEK